MSASVILAGKDYFTVEEAAQYAGISYSHWRAKVQVQFPPGMFYGKQIYRRLDVDRWQGIPSQQQLRKLDLERRRQRTNPALYAAKRAIYRAAKRQRTPAWADLSIIADIYRECAEISRRTGIPHAVDHIVPLMGKTVCGLHVEYNLRIITATENSRKGNRHV